MGEKQQFHEMDAEIFSAGTWNGDLYTEADLDNMVSNFSSLSGVVKPPVKLGHNDKQIKDGQPALGWVKAVKREGAKLIATLSEVPELVYSAIKEGLYKRISSEVFWDYKQDGNIYKRVLAGVALLGSDIPAINNMEDLQAFLSQSTVDPGSFDRLCAYAFDVDKAGQILTKKRKGLNEMEKHEYESKIAKAEAKTLAADNARKLAEDNAKKEADDAKEYKAEVEADRLEEKKTVRFSEVKAYCEGMVEKGRMLPAQRDLIVDEKHQYSNDDFSFDFDTVKKVLDLSGKVVEFKKEHGKKKDESKTYTNASDEVAVRATKYAAENKVSYREASEAVLAADPKLAQDNLMGGDE